MCIFNFSPIQTELGVSGTYSSHYVHRMFWQLVLCMYSPSSSSGVEADGNQIHPSSQNNMSYMGPLTPAGVSQLLEEIPILVQIMGIIHYLFTLVKTVKMLIFPWPTKMTSVTSCEYTESERHAYLNTSGGHKRCKVNKPHPSFSSKFVWIKEH